MGSCRAQGTALATKDPHIPIPTPYRQGRGGFCGPSAELGSDLLSPSAVAHTWLGPPWTVVPHQATTLGGCMTDGAPRNPCSSPFPCAGTTCPHSPHSAPSWSPPPCLRQGALGCSWRGRAGSLQSCCHPALCRPDGHGSSTPTRTAPALGSVWPGAGPASMRPLLGKAGRGRLRPKFFHVPPARVN